MNRLLPLLLLFTVTLASHHYQHRSNHDLRLRRDVDSLIEKHLHWLTEEQKEVIRTMKKNGEDLAEIKKKLMSYVMDGDKKKIKSCDTWYEEVTTLEERNILKGIAQLDRALCRRRLGEYMSRLSPERKNKAQDTIEDCLKDVCGVVHKPRSRRSLHDHWELSDAFYMSYIPDARRYFTFS